MTDRPVREPSLEEVPRAGAVVARHLVPTPVIPSPRLGPAVVLKLETFQPTGSFKVRGGLVAVASALTGDRERLVLTASAGNHGLGVAYAAYAFGVKAIVVIPENASEAKREALQRFDVEIVRHGTTYEETEAHALSLADGFGGQTRFISPYNDPDVIAGQGTIALELFDQVPDLTTMIAPVGGGGLVAGLALAASGRPGVGVHGVEAAASPAVSSSVAAGQTVVVPIGTTLADGLAGNLEPGSVTVPMIAQRVEEMTGVDEDSIRDAVRFLAVEHGLVVEPSGAVAVAALLSGRMEPGRGPTAVLVTGRNVAPPLFARLVVGER